MSTYNGQKPDRELRQSGVNRSSRRLPEPRRPHIRRTARALRAARTRRARPGRAIEQAATAQASHRRFTALAAHVRRRTVAHPVVSHDVQPLARNGGARWRTGRVGGKKTPPSATADQEPTAQAAACLSGRHVREPSHPRLRKPSPRRAGPGGRARDRSACGPGAGVSTGPPRPRPRPTPRWRSWPARPSRLRSRHTSKGFGTTGQQPRAGTGPSPTATPSASWATQARWRDLSKVQLSVDR